MTEANNVVEARMLVARASSQPISLATTVQVVAEDTPAITNMANKVLPLNPIKSPVETAESGIMISLVKTADVIIL